MQLVLQNEEKCDNIVPNKADKPVIPFREFTLMQVERSNCVRRVFVHDSRDSVSRVKLKVGSQWEPHREGVGGSQQTEQISRNPRSLSRPESAGQVTVIRHRVRAGY